MDLVKEIVIFSDETIAKIAREIGRASCRERV